MVTRQRFQSLFLFDGVRSRESYNLYCTTILSGAETKFDHQFDVITGALSLSTSDDVTLVLKASLSTSDDVITFQPYAG